MVFHVKEILAQHLDPIPVKSGGSIAGDEGHAIPVFLRYLKHVPPVRGRSSIKKENGYAHGQQSGLAYRRGGDDRDNAYFGGCVPLRVLWSDSGMAVVVGRNMDWHEDTKTNLWAMPCGIERDGGVGKNSSDIIAVMDEKGVLTSAT